MTCQNMNDYSRRSTLTISYIAESWLYKRQKQTAYKEHNFNKMK